jgi:hypothetical protein
MKFIRIIVFILCFYLVVPFDLYITAHYRIYYFGTDMYQERVHFSDDNPALNYTANYTFNLQNCKVYLKPDTESGQSFFLEYGFDFGIPFEFNQTQLTIRALPTQTCIVNLYLQPNINLPHFYFNITGNQDNIMFDDSGMNGIPLNFGRGLDITGDTAYIYLRSHSISALNLTLKFAVVQLRQIQCPVRTITLDTGMYNDVLDPKTPGNMVIVRASQPGGNICLSGPFVN